MTKGNGEAILLLFVCIASGGTVIPLILLLALVAEMGGPNKK